MYTGQVSEKLCGVDRNTTYSFSRRLAVGNFSLVDDFWVTFTKYVSFQKNVFHFPYATVACKSGAKNQMA